MITQQTTQFKLCIKQYMNRELPDVQAGFRKGRGTRDQIANICWIIKRDGNTRPPDLPLEKSVCRSGSNS